MAKLDEEKKFLGTDNQTASSNPYAAALGASTIRPKEQAGSGDVDYYENLKNESYKTMLKKEVQAAVAQDQARKYTANAMRGAGLNTQGIAQSTQLGIGNAYTTALNNAQNEYNQSILDINQQQRQEQLATDTANSNADYELLASAIRKATSAEELAMIKEKMADFNFDENSLRSLNFLYELQNQQLGVSEEGTINSNNIANIVSSSKEKTAQSIYNDLKSVSLNKVEFTGTNLETFVAKGSNGDIIQVNLERPNGTTALYGYYMLYNGQLYKVEKTATQGRKIETMNAKIKK